MTDTGQIVMRGERLGMIEAGRGIAALSVVLFHANTIVKAHVAGAPAFAAFELGERGVDFFFVLSGFIITLVHFGDIADATRTGWFVRKRLVRIYPLLWAVVSATVLMNVVLDGEVYGFEKLFTSYTLWPSLAWPSPSVAWTLRHEMLFYLLFAALILSRRFGVVLLACWLAATGVQTAMMIAGSSFGGIAAMLFSPLNLQFAAGCIVAILYSRRGGTGWPGSLAGGAALLAVTIVLKIEIGLPARAVLDYQQSAGVWLDLAFALVFALIVYGLAGASKEVRTPRFLLLLGAASYAIYLVHTAVMGLAGRALPLLITPALAAAGVGHLILALIAIAVGVAAHLLFEKPVGRWLARRLHRRATPVHASA